MIRSRLKAFLVSCAFAGGILPLSAQVQTGEFESFDPLRNDSVLNRARPDYDPDGMRLGSFNLYPSLGVGYAYDSNVRRTDTAAQSDSLFTVTPRVSISSDWTRHMLRAFAAATRYQYVNLDSERRTAWTMGTQGRLDLISGSSIDATATYLSTFEARTSQEQLNAARPTPFQKTDVNLVFSYNPSSFGVRFGGAFERYAFDPTQLTVAAGGGLLNNIDRNRETYTAFMVGLYEFSPGYGAFVRPSYSKRTYDVKDGRAAGRDANVYQINGGLSLLLTEFITGEAYLGYLHHDFSGANFSSLTGLNYGANINWYPSTLLTLHLNASRTPSATVLGGASSRDDRRFEVGADYEVLLNVILQGGAAYTDTRFVGITRQDEDINVYGGVRYLINSNFSADANFVRSVRNSTVVDRGFVDNMVSLRLTARR